MDYRKFGIFLGLAFVLFYVVADPTGAYGLMADALGGIGHAMNNLAAFTKRLVA